MDDTERFVKKSQRVDSAAKGHTLSPFPPLTDEVMKVRCGARTSDLILEEATVQSGWDPERRLKTLGGHYMEGVR